jgi:ABC-type iron transport system FetAB permease component
MFVTTLAVVAGTAALTMAYALLVVMRVRPWWTPQYLIPILGMCAGCGCGGTGGGAVVYHAFNVFKPLQPSSSSHPQPQTTTTTNAKNKRTLGNTISGISVGLGVVIDELSAGANRVEKLLALGATRWEATRAPVRRAVRLAMTPLLNQMSVVGLVSIPGMMTGQILAGSDPSDAARYQVPRGWRGCGEKRGQMEWNGLAWLSLGRNALTPCRPQSPLSNQTKKMVIMFLLGAAATLGAVVAIHAAVLHLVDGRHRLRTDRLIAKGSGGGGIAWVKAQLAELRACCGGRRRRPQSGDTNEPLLGGS